MTRVSFSWGLGGWLSPSIENVSVPLSWSVWALIPSGKVQGRTPIPTRLERWIRSKLSGLGGQGNSPLGGTCRYCRELRADPPLQSCRDGGPSLYLSRRYQCPNTPTQRNRNIFDRGAQPATQTPRKAHSRHPAPKWLYRENHNCESPRYSGGGRVLPPRRYPPLRPPPTPLPLTSTLTPQKNHPLTHYPLMVYMGSEVLQVTDY